MCIYCDAETDSGSVCAECIRLGLDRDLTEDEARAAWLARDGRF